MAKMKIILWGAWYGSRNVGDQALLLSITDLLGDAFNNMEFVVITDNPSNVLEYTNRDSAYAFLPVHARKQFFDVLKAFMDADLFIFGGGVPFYDDTFHSIVIAALVTLARIFHIPCVLWSVSSQRIHSRFTRLVLRYLLSYASIVTYRDMHTRQLFQECGKDDFAQQIVADSVFTLRLGDRQNAENILARAGWDLGHIRPLVALTPRLLRGSDGEAHTHYSPRTNSDSQKEIEVFAVVLDSLWENGYQPVFVPMNTVAPDDDREISRKVMARAKFGGNALIVDEEIYPRDAANVYSYCEAAFVARVHGAVTAFLGRCPMLMYAFDLKHGGIMEQIGASERAFDPYTGSPTDAVKMLQTILQSRVDLVSQMDDKAIELREQAGIPRDAILLLLHKT